MLDLKAAANHNDLFRILESMNLLKQFSLNIPMQAKTVLSTPKYQIIENVSEVLHVLAEQTKGDQDGYRSAPIFHSSIAVMREYIWSAHITEQRILGCKFFNIVGHFLYTPMPHKERKLQDIFTVLANCIRESEKLATLALSLKIHTFAIQFVRELSPAIETRLFKQFLFFVRSLLEQLFQAPTFS